MSSRATASSTTTASPKQQTQAAQATQPTQHAQHGQQQASNTHGMHDKIAMRAYEKWCKKGCPHGTDKQDWLEAEKEVRMELGRQGTGSNTRR